MEGGHMFSHLAAEARTEAAGGALKGLVLGQGALVFLLEHLMEGSLGILFVHLNEEGIRVVARADVLVQVPSPVGATAAVTALERTVADGWSC